jgi:glycosyltransferase involved in cell wall biosynthesis
MKRSDIYLVIPAYNEQTKLPRVISGVEKVFDLKKVIVVDDGSTPPLRLKADKYTLLRHDQNRGKGAAMHTGADAAFESGAKAVIFMDADGQHDPQELPEFVDKLTDGFDVVFGARMMPINTPLIRFMGNKFSSMYVSLIFGIYLSDILSGYRGLTQKAYKLMYWVSDGYSVETEMVARLARNKYKLKYAEFPILGIYLDANKGMSLTDAFKVLWDSLVWKVKFLISDSRP